MVKIKKHTLILLALFPFYAACIPVAEPNTRWYLKDNVTFSANLYLDGSRMYNRLEIGTPSRSFSKNTPLFVFLIEDKIMRSDDIDVSLFKKLSTGIADPNQFGEMWPSGSELYFLSGYSILVHEEEVLVFYAGTKGNPQPVPKLGTVGSEKLYTMPLREEEVVEIFGKEDELKEFFIQ